jgi:hypothetical protein
MQQSSWWTGAEVPAVKSLNGNFWENEVTSCFRGMSEGRASRRAPNWIRLRESWYLKFQQLWFYQTVTKLEITSMEILDKILFYCYGLDGRGSISGRGKIYLCHTASRPTLVPTQLPIQRVAGIKRPESESDHSPQSNVELKNWWSYTSSSPYVFAVWCLINLIQE